MKLQCCLNSSLGCISDECEAFWLAFVVHGQPQVSDLTAFTKVFSNGGLVETERETSYEDLEFIVSALAAPLTFFYLYLFLGDRCGLCLFLIVGVFVTISRFRLRCCLRLRLWGWLVRVIIIGVIGGWLCLR